MQWYVENYSDHPSNYLTVDLAGLAPNDVVVDIGCGAGTAVRHAATLVTEGRVFGVDPTPGMIRVARERTTADPNRERISFIEASAGKIPLDDDTATVVLAINALHHFADPVADLHEIRRILGPHGRLVLGDEDWSSREEHEMPPGAHEAADHDGGEFGHAALKDPERAAKLLEDCGFAEVTLGRHTRGEVSIYLTTCRVP